ncbi:hypothetical protein BSL78_29864, partial [Apostichopus japonicus]
HIREILLGKLNGDTLVKEMEDGLISYQSRKQIVNILVSHLIEHHSKHPRSVVKLSMALAIINEFPLLDNEDKDGHEVWFCAGIGRHEATGYLENRLRNVRRRDQSKTKSVPDPSKPSKLVDTTVLELTSDDAEDCDISSMVTWLKYHNAPKERVKEMMERTCKHRTSYIRDNKESSVGDILSEYPRLIDTDGMIDQDFIILFGQVSDSLYMKWTRYFPKVLVYVEKQVDWKQVLKFSGEVQTGIKKIGKRKQHATVDQACRCFIQVEKIGTNIPSFLEKVDQPQPFVLALGRREQPEQVFCIVERRALPCQGLLQGVDLCFKLFYILDINYPWECQNTWDFLQKAIYNLGKGKGRDKSVPSVTLFKNFLNQKD